jgi:hypothetical protein
MRDWTKNRLFKQALRLAQADMVFYLLPPLMLVLTLSTLAQRDLGLYEAHQRYFVTFGYPLLALLTLNLTLKFFLQSAWGWKKSGIILTH